MARFHMMSPEITGDPIYRLHCWECDQLMDFLAVEAIYRCSSCGATSKYEDVFNFGQAAGAFPNTEIIYHPKAEH